MRKVPLYLLIICFIHFSCACGLLPLGGYHKLREAEELSRQNKFDEAIAAYQAHMQRRLAAKGRPEWENPYFYFLLIGDLELGRGNVSKALQAYDTAKVNNIHSSLISDRYRFVAHWYEERGEFYKAIEILEAHRDLDTLLFDAMLDRISKEIIRRQDEMPVATPTVAAK